MPVGATISPLNLSDTFQTWFNRTNALITDVNTIDITGITPSSVNEDGLTFDFSGTSVQIGFLGVTNMTQDIVFGGQVTFSNVPEGRFVNSVNGSTGDVTIVVSGVATQGSSAGSVPIFSSSEAQFTGVQVYPQILSEVDHVFGVLGSFTSGFSGGQTTEYTNFIQYATGGGAVFGLGQSGGSGGDITADYESNAQFGEVELYGFTGAQLALFQQHSAYGISGHAAQTGGFYIRYGDIGGGAASNMGVLFRSGNTLGVQGTPLIALNLEKDTVALGSTSALAADGFFSLISPSGDFNRDYNPLTILGDGHTFAIRHGKAENILDAKEPVPGAQFGPTYDTLIHEHPINSGSTHHERNEFTSLQGFRTTGNVVDRISGKAGSNIGFEVRGSDGSFSVMSNFGSSAGTGDDTNTDDADIQRIAFNIDQKGNVVIGGKDRDDGLLGGPTGHQSYFLGLGTADAPWGYTAGYTGNATNLVGVVADTSAVLDTYPDHQYGVTFQGYPDGFGTLNIVSGRLHIKGSAGNTQAYIEGKNQYLFTDGVSCEWRTSPETTMTTFMSSFGGGDDNGVMEIVDRTDATQYASSSQSLMKLARRATMTCSDDGTATGNFVTGKANVTLSMRAFLRNDQETECTSTGLGLFVSTDKGTSFTAVDGSGFGQGEPYDASYLAGKMHGSEALSTDLGDGVGLNCRNSGLSTLTKSVNFGGIETINPTLMHTVDVPADGGLVVKIDMYHYLSEDLTTTLPANGTHGDGILVDANANPFKMRVDFAGSDF